MVRCAYAIENAALFARLLASSPDKRQDGNWKESSAKEACTEAWYFAEIRRLARNVLL
ncbi:MAG: hypothetical protein OXI87_22830 [Albidovulum sp.]|nr:hypothetical protein [Albidovulum sp.]